MTHHYIEELPAYISNPSPQWVDDNVDTFCTHEGDHVLVIIHRVLKMRVNSRLEVSRQLICEIPDNEGEYITIYYRDVTEDQELNTTMIAHHAAILESFNYSISRQLADAKEIVTYLEKITVVLSNAKGTTNHV